MNAVIQVEGLWCSSCALSAQKKLLSIRGVEETKVSFVLGSAWIHFDEEQTNIEEICSSLGHLGYAARFEKSKDAQDQEEQQRKHFVRLAVAIFFGMWVMLIQLAYYIEPHSLMPLLGMIFSIPVVFFSGFSILRIGIRTLFQGTPTLDSLVSIAVLAGMGLSIPSLWGYGHPWWDTVCMLIVFLHVGRLIEHRLRKKGLALQESFSSTLEDDVFVWQQEGWKRTRLSEVEQGSRIRIMRDSIVPVDGCVVKEPILVDNSAWTGEAEPVWIQQDEEVLAGASLLSQEAEIVVERCFGQRRIDDVLSQTERLLLQRETPSPFQHILGYWMWFSLLFSIGYGFLFWFWGYEQWDIMNRALSLLLITCPCSLSIAVPIVVQKTMNQLGKEGVLLKDAHVLWSLVEARRIYFDKTGTLTEGKPSIQYCSDPQFLPLMAAMEQSSTHPFAKAFQHIDAESLHDDWHIENLVAKGVLAVHKQEEKEYRIGSQKWFDEEGIDIPNEWREKGCNVFLAEGTACLAGLSIEDAPRTEASRVWKKLQQTHDLFVLSGDSLSMVHQVMHGIDPDVPKEKIFGALSPFEKQYHIADGSVYVGDGLNDAMALGASSVGISLEAGHQMIQQHADIVLTDGLDALPTLFAQAHRSIRIIRQNLLWAILYNCICVPIAMMGLFVPQIALFVMLTSSIGIQLNSMRVHQRSIKD